MLHQIVFTKLLGEIDYGAGGLNDFNAAGYNAVGKWNWNTHGSDWIYQGGPDSTDVKGDPYFNQWEDFDDSPVTWHITEPVMPLQTEPWLEAVGGGLY